MFLPTDPDFDADDIFGSAVVTRTQAGFSDDGPESLTTTVIYADEAQGFEGV